MPTRLTSALLLSLVLVTSACESSMKTPDIKQNPHPTKRYEITLTIKDAPGPFDSVTGFVQYKVSNDKCVPLQPVSGATLAPEYQASLELRRAGDNIYQGYIYTDLLQDENYFDMGVCHWEVVAAVAVLHVNHVDFSPNLLKKDILDQHSETRFFTHQDFVDARAGKDNMLPSDPGEPRASAYKRALQDHLFSVTLATKEKSP